MGHQLSDCCGHTHQCTANRKDWEAAQSPPHCLMCRSKGSNLGFLINKVSKSPAPMPQGREGSLVHRSRRTQPS